MAFDTETVAAVWHVNTSEAELTLIRFLQTDLLNLSDGLYKMHPLLSVFAKELLQNASQDEQKEVRKAYDEYIRKRQGN